MRTSHVIPLLAGTLGLAPAALSGQANLFPHPAVLGGADVRQYTFGDRLGFGRIRQAAFPAALVVPVGRRLSFDIGSQYAVTTVRDTAGVTRSLSGFTDTQIRGSYIVGNDVLVVSVMVNLPTGKETTTLGQFGLASRASSTFLVFPVNSYGSGTSVTPGLALATTAGSWNLGFAGSLRLSESYQPFSDDPTLRYDPGVETRLRAGVDHLVGRGRFSMGFTFSTFSSDELLSGLGSAIYDPGNRFLAEAALLLPAGRGSVAFHLWDYYRVSGTADTSATSVGNRENIVAGGVSARLPLGTGVSFEPLAEARFWSPERGNGRLLGFGAAFRLGTGRFRFVPGGRVDLGRLETPTGIHDTLRGWSLSALVSVGTGS